MKKNTIQVYGRLKPLKESEKESQEEYRIQVSDEANKKCFREKLVLTHKPSGEMVNNKPESHTFRFCKVFDQHIKQKDIFAMVAKPVVDSVLEGYNGTVFAYGQTGSGKTFSIIGGVNQYSDRGMIPRSIEYVFTTIEAKTNETIYSVSVSFCEIYNDCGYDLLDPKLDSNNVEDMLRVSVCEDAEGNFQMRNLSLNKVASKEEALNFLFIGEKHRVTSETPMNPRSSRSHCLFTIHLSARDPQSPIVRHSKLNLVDLSGSERVYKSCIDGRTLEEAKHINQSLHFLEQVIVGLSDSERRHIPYRNSMMTTVLKDSLGGNCLTTMLATLSLHSNNIGETVSTCRFAQRVALIKTVATVNEAIDPVLELEILRHDINMLKSELTIYKSSNLEECLSTEESGECEKLVMKIINSKEKDLSLVKIPKDMRKIYKCFAIFKSAVQVARHQQTAAQAVSKKEIVKYQDLLRKRDEEIVVLKVANKVECRLKPSATSGDESIVAISRLGDEPVTMSDNTRSSPSNHSTYHSQTDSYAISKSKLVCSLPPEEQQQFKEYVSRHPSQMDVHNLGERLKLKVNRAKELETDNVIRESDLTSLRTLEGTLINTGVLESHYEDSVKPSIMKLEDVLGNSVKKQNDLNEAISYLEHKADEKVSVLVSEFQEISKLGRTTFNFTTQEQENDISKNLLSLSSRSRYTSSPDAQGYSPRSLIMDDFMGGCSFGTFCDTTASNQATKHNVPFYMDDGDGKNRDRLKVQEKSFVSYGNNSRRNSYNTGSCETDLPPYLILNDDKRRINTNNSEQQTGCHLENSPSELGKIVGDRLKIMTNSEHNMLSDAKREIFKDMKRSLCDSRLSNDSKETYGVQTDRNAIALRNVDNGQETCGLDFESVCSVKHSNISPDHENIKQDHFQYNFQPLEAQNMQERNSSSTFIGYPVNMDNPKSANSAKVENNSDTRKSESKTIFLTGDKDVDEEIIEFYKSHNSSFMFI